MQDRLQRIIPETWTVLDVLFTLTFIAAAIWLVSAIFVMWRRHASNLTPVNAAHKNRKAQPDFLSVDKAARAEAIARGEGFDKELERREREEARMATAAVKGAEKGQSIAGWVSFILAVVSLLTGLLGVVFNMVRLEGMTSEFGSLDRIVGLFKTYPVSSAVVVIIIGLKIVHFIMLHNKTKEG